MNVFYKTLDGLNCVETAPTESYATVMRDWKYRKRACHKRIDIAKFVKNDSPIAEVFKIRTYALIRVEGNYWADNVYMEEVD